MLHVLNIGSIVQDAACYSAILGRALVYPDQYCIRRPVFPPSAPSSKPGIMFADATAELPAMAEPFFTASVAVTVSAGNAASVAFTVTRSDDPAAKTYTSTKGPTGAWRLALEAAAADFPDRQGELPASNDAKGRMQVNGIRLYGLHLQDVQERLKALPGGAAAFAAASAAQLQVPGAAAPSTEAETASKPRRGKGAKGSTTAGAARADSPAPRASADARAATTASATKSGSRKRASRTVSVDKEASNSVAISAVVDADGGVSSQPPSVVAVSPTKTPRPRKPKAAAEAAEGAAAAAGADGAAPPAKRRRASKKAAADGSAPTPPAAPAASAAASMVVVVCPDCGLAGTPFCAATGKPHDFPPCPVCGLKSAFCPITGQPHAGPAQRENRQRGEVHLPGVARKPRRRTGAAVTVPDAVRDSGVAEVTVVSTQDGSGSLTVVEGGEAAVAAAKKPQRKRARADGAGEGAVLGEENSNADGAPAEGSAGPRPRRSRKKKDGEAAAAGVGGTGEAGQNADGDTSTTAPASKEEAAAAAAEAEDNEKSLFELALETIYIYPPLRPPLTSREHHKAAHLLQEQWKAQYGEGPVLPPAVAAVPLAFVPARRAKGRRGTDVKAEDGEDDEDKAPAEEGAVAAVGEETEGHSPPSSAVGSPTSAAVGGATDGPLPTMVHPLEVSQLATSVAGKRLSKFMLQYVSERAQFDLLRSHAAAAAAAASGGAGKKVAKAKASAENEAVADGEQRGDDETAEGNEAEADRETGAAAEDGGAENAGDDEGDETAVAAEDVASVEAS